LFLRNDSTDTQTQVNQPPLGRVEHLGNRARRRIIARLGEIGSVISPRPVRNPITGSVAPRAATQPPRRRETPHGAMRADGIPLDHQAWCTCTPSYTRCAYHELGTLVSKCRPNSVARPRLRAADARTLRIDGISQRISLRSTHQDTRRHPLPTPRRVIDPP
jgi:hypothetical protein